ncbi:hypothetical protein [Salipiger sp.]|uniref:hypothetical protein n=1 Tax=Salipiger sp. TaxID=2078585 RepID=UPI003A96C20C
MRLPALAAGLSLAALLCATGAGAGCPDLPPPGQGLSVLRYDVTRGDGPRTPPLLEIDSDGAVAVRLGEEVRRGAMTRAALAELLDTMVRDEALPEIDTAALDTALSTPLPDARGGVVVGAVADASTSHLVLELPGCRHSVAVQGSALRSRMRPDLGPLQRFRRIELRLHEIIAPLQQG